MSGWMAMQAGSTCCKNGYMMVRNHPGMGAVTAGNALIYGRVMDFAVICNAVYI